MNNDQRSCGVQLCPAFARPGHDFCVAHSRAKKLAQVANNEQCRSCHRQLHVGDYVTLLSTSGQNHHANCPERHKRPQPTGPVSTPLFDDEPTYATR